MNIIKRVLKKLLEKLGVVSKKEIYPVPLLTNLPQILNEKVALVVGGSGGIGFEIAKVFVNCGAKVIITGTNEEKLKRKVAEIETATESSNIKYVILNLNDIDSIEKSIIEAGEMFGNNRIDILVNSAGVNPKSSFGFVTEEEYDNVMNVNLKGVFFVCQHMSKYMIERNIKGHILNVSSASGIRPAWTPYEISKWGLNGFTKGLADYCIAHGIVVNAIAPGPVATDMLGKKEGDSIYNASSPSGRYAMPSEIANLAAFMVSDMGDLIIGDTYHITGGGGTISYHR